MSAPATHRPMNVQEWGLLILLSVIWGGSFFFTKIAVAEIPPLTIVFLRLALGAMVLNIILRSLKLSLPRDPKIWTAFLVMGLMNNMLPFTLLVWGQTHIASGLASILNATVPLFSIVIAHFFVRDEKASRLRILGVMLGFIGIVSMIGPDALKGLGGDVLAQLACLTAAFSYACAGFYGKRFKDMGLKPMVTATGQVTVSAFIMLFISLFADQPWTLPVPSTNTILSILGLGILSTSFAYTLYFKLLASAGASNLMLVTFLIPVTAILLGVLVLGEILHTSEIIGMLLIALGLLAIDGRILKNFRKTLP